eukprot:754386-Hanusia_phi.AAC.1
MLKKNWKESSTRRREDWKRVVVIQGKERLKIPCKLSSSFGNLKEQISELTGISASQQKLIYKGKVEQPRDSDILQAAGVKNGDKMMLMASPAAGKDSTQEEKKRLTEKNKEDLAEAQKLRDRHRDGALDAPAQSTTTHQETIMTEEDGLVPGQPSIVISQGKVKYRVAIGAASRRVEELKQSVASLTGAAAKFHRLIHRGRELKDSASMEELGLKDGDKMLLLFAEGHHKAVDETALVEEMKEDVRLLEEDLSKLTKKCEHGLFGDDQNEISIRIGVLNQVAAFLDNLLPTSISILALPEAERLLDNVRYLERTAEGRELRSAAEEKLKSLMQTLESLRMKHVVGAHRK